MSLGSSTCQTCRASRSSALVPSFQISPAWQWSRSTALQKRAQLPLSPPAVLPTGGGTFKEGPLCMLPGKAPMPTSGACSTPACPVTHKAVSTGSCAYCYTPSTTWWIQLCLHNCLPHVYVSIVFFTSVSVCCHVLRRQGNSLPSPPSLPRSSHLVQAGRLPPSPSLLPPPSRTPVPT